MSATATDLTPDSRDLFEALVEDAPNWSGSPLITVSPAGRGNLTHLKRLGLIETFVDEGCAFAVFTDDGKALAKALNLPEADSLDYV